jgi:hypothetical protein
MNDEELDAALQQADENSEFSGTQRGFLAHLLRMED